MKNFENTTSNDELCYLTILYYLSLAGKYEFNTSVGNSDLSPIDKEITYLYTKNYISIVENKYVIAPLGAEIMKKVCALIENLGKFEIFSSVSVDLTLPLNIKKDDVHVLDYVHDPRFVYQEKNTEDLRIAMMQYFHESCRRSGQTLEKINYIKAIYLQNIFYAQYSLDYAFWFDLKLNKLFDEAKEIYANAFSIEDFDEDPEVSYTIASEIYRAGISEDIKRYGRHCNSCEAPVGLFESEREIAECPNPNCRSNLFAADSSYITSADQFRDREYEYVYETYEYQPYGFYHPYDPYLDAVAFGFVCGAILI